MSDAEFEDLTHRHLDGRTTPVEAARLSERLEADEVARLAYLQLARLHAALAAEPMAVAPLPPAPPPRPLRQRLAIGQLAAGLVIGVLSSSLVWAYAPPNQPVPPPAGEPLLLPLADGGFESGRPPGTDWLPTSPGVWGGDFARLTGPEQGVTPHTGQYMLRLLRPDNQRGMDRGQRAAEQWQVIDLRPLRPRLGSEPLQVELAAWFTTAGEDEADRSCGVCLMAFRGEPEDARTVWPVRTARAVATASCDRPLTGRPGHWQRVAVRGTVPPDADGLVAEVRVNCRPPRPAAFPGHYVDDVTVCVLPP